MNLSFLSYHLWENKCRIWYPISIIDYCFPTPTTGNRKAQSSRKKEQNLDSSLCLVFTSLEKFVIFSKPVDVWRRMISFHYHDLVGCELTTLQQRKNSNRNRGEINVERKWIPLISLSQIPLPCELQGAKKSSELDAL